MASFSFKLYIIYHVHPYVGSPANSSTGMMLFFSQGRWGEVVRYERFVSEMSISHDGDVSLVETCWNFEAKEKAKNVVAELTWPEIDAFLRGLGWVDWCWGFLGRHVWNLSGLWHMFWRMHHHAVCVGPPPHRGKHVITTFWSHINACSFVWKVIILPWRAHQMKAIMWATLQEFQGPSTMAVSRHGKLKIHRLLTK